MKRPPPPHLRVAGKGTTIQEQVDWFADCLVRNDPERAIAIAAALNKRLAVRR